VTDRQRLEIRSSEIRERLNEIAGMDDLTDEVRTESEGLTAELRDVETKRRAAIAAEPEPEVRETEHVDPETRERLELRSKASLGGFLLAALRGRLPAGELAEYQAACGCDDGIPVELFEADRPRREVRADAATAAPSSGTGATLAPVQPFVFAESIAPMLGIEMPTVGSGAYSEATISTALTAAATAKGTKRESTAATLTAVTANPRRIAARLSLTLEDVAAVGQANFEAALRENARMALGDAYDTQAITGNGTAPNVNGMIAQLTNPTDPTAVATFDSFQAAFADQIDGLWARTLMDVAMVANVDAYKLSAKAYRDKVIDSTDTNQVRAAASLGEVTFADYALKHTGGWWTNKRMPASASNIARAIVYRKGRPGLRTACHPVWGEIGIDDIYSDSGSGIRHFTLNLLVGDKVLLVQPSAYALAEFKVA